ncbi:MAG TPA: cyclic pyranopterin monophosphate synthase MoaC [Candidatus Korarchaeota archaeon]|nr:cyclic pyranopterin monophosphate synthase MoaC [Candidatus Korarchaeota archaeon]
MPVVDITPKPEVYREAKAVGRIRLKKDTVERIRSGMIEKGDPLLTAKIAAVMAAKKTSESIPFCHPIQITHVDVQFRILDERTIEAEATVKARAKTGVEMEALVAVSTALLTIWDMTKQYEKDRRGQYPTTEIFGIKVLAKVKEEGK